MGRPALPLRTYIDRLRAKYGRPKRPIPSGPFEWIIWEHIGDQADDDQRAIAFRALRQKLGTTPQAILGAPKGVIIPLLELAGPDAGARLEKLRKASQVMIEIGLARLRTLVRENPAEAKKLIKKFPGIGEPGADRILLFCKSMAGLAPDPHGARVLSRLGFGKPGSSFPQVYEHVKAAIQPELPRDYNWLVQAHQLLRRHGLDLCKSSSPRCGECPLAADCAWYLAH